MTLQVQITALAQAIANDIKSLTANQGQLSSLQTGNKANLVAAINELKNSLGSVDLTSLIDDGSESSLIKTYSIDKINAKIEAAITALLDGAPEAFNTLKELADALSNDETGISALVTAVGNRVQFDAAQALTDPQKLQACQNIGVGDPTTNFTAAYNLAKA